MSRTKLNSSAFFPALICFALLAALACNSVQFTPGVGGNSGSLVYNGVTYSTSLDEAGNIVVTTSDGTTLKMGANGSLIESTAPDGATLAIVNQGGNNLDVTTSFPEFQDTSRPKTLRTSGEYAAQAVRTICDQISETCDLVERYLTYLRAIQDTLVDSYQEDLGDSFSRDFIAGVIEAHLQRTENHLTNFCAGWNLALLLNQNPCDPEAGQPCDTPAGSGWVAIENDATLSSLEDPFDIQINGTSATATLKRVRGPIEGAFIELPLTMTGTLSQGSGGCAKCTVFQGTWTGEFDEGLDALSASANPNYVPPQRTFNIVFAEDNRSFTGNVFEDSRTLYKLDGQRNGCP
jgi:hypothetical protein